jgi:hypothetical protein
MDSSITDRSLHQHVLLLMLLHSLLFLVILSLGLLYFQFSFIDLLWYSTWSDSWKYIENMLSPLRPPYPYHLIGTSLHFLIPYTFLSNIFPASDSLTLSIIGVQFLASTGAVIIFYSLLLVFYKIKSGQALVITFLLDSCIFSLFVLQATSEILFLFYQALAWLSISKKHYYFGIFTAAMSFSLRFNGIIVLGTMLAFAMLHIQKNVEHSRMKIFEVVLVILIAIIISLFPYIWSFIGTGEFFTPLTSEIVAYQSLEYYARSWWINVPFIWWIDYVQQVFKLSDISEFKNLLLSVLAFILTLLSIIVLYIDQNKNIVLQKQFAKPLFFITTINFIALNTIVSGRQLARFISFTIPIFPILAFITPKIGQITRKQILIYFLFVILTIISNLFYWSFFTPCSECKHHIV